MIEHADTSKLYKTQWMAYFKPGLGSPTIVYSETEREALANALAHYRKGMALVDKWPLEKVVDRVECLDK